MANQENIEKLRVQMQDLQNTLNHYETLFLADGFIDSVEQLKLDSIRQSIQLIEGELDRRSGIPSAGALVAEKRMAKRKQKRKEKAVTNKKVMSAIGAEMEANASIDSGVPSTVEQFVAYCKTKNISTGNKIKIDKTIDLSGTDMKIEIKANPTIVICPAPAIKGKISIRLKGIEKALKKEMGMESGFEYDFDNHNCKLDFEAEEIFKLELNNANGVTTVYIEVNIMTIITGTATKFLEELTGEVLKLTTNGIMSIKGKWDSKGFELVKIGGAIALGVKADFSKNEEIKEKLGKYSPVIEASAAIDINTEYNGDEMDVTTAEGKTIVKVKIGGFDYEFTQEGKGEAIGSEAERMAAMEGALLLAMQAATKEVDLSDESRAYQLVAAKKADRIFISKYYGYREKIEEKIKAKLADYYLVDALFEVSAASGVRLKYADLLKRIYTKDGQVQKVLEFLKKDRELKVRILKEEKLILGEADLDWKSIWKAYGRLAKKAPVNIPNNTAVLERLKRHKATYQHYQFYVTLNRATNLETMIHNIEVMIKRTKKLQSK